MSNSLHRIEKIVFAEKGATCLSNGNLGSDLLQTLDPCTNSDGGGYATFDVDQLEQFLEDAVDLNCEYDPNEVEQLRDDIKVARERGDDVIEYSIH